jgi:acyl-CoA synthetase (AMP-forming)/AMP-acid ligase II
VHAVVVTKPGAAVPPESLMALVKRELGSVSAPKTVAFAAELPVNPAGKVDKKSLRAPFWQGRSRQVG